MRSCGQNQKGIRYKNTKKTLLICFRENFITLFSLTDFQDFPGPALLFQDFPVLENAIIKFQDFPGFPGPVRTLREPLRVPSKVLKLIKHRKLRSKIKRYVKESVPSSVLFSIATNYKLWIIKVAGRQESFSTNFFR